MTQVSLWQQSQKSPDYAELCNALYEREIRYLSGAEQYSIQQVQAKLKSLPYYVQRTADNMITTESPLTLDTQNGMWSAKQSRAIPLSGQLAEDVWQWYTKVEIKVGLVVPILVKDHIVLDSVDRVDKDNRRFRTNLYGWFKQLDEVEHNRKILKPTKKVMIAACAGHCWQDTGPVSPKIPSMRELLLSCSINWRNFKRPLQIIGR